MTMLPKSAFPALGPILSAVVLGAVLSLSTAVAQAPEAADASAFPAVVAKVNGIEISKAELLTQASIVRAQARAGGGIPPVPSREFYRQILEGLVGETLIYDEGLRTGVVATDGEVERAIAGMREQAGDPAAFEATLEAQGTTLERLQGQIRRTLTIQKMLQSGLGAEAKVSEDEVRRFYDDNRERLTIPPRLRLRHILAKAEDPNDPESLRKARGRLAEIRSRVEAGGDFAELAREYSDDSDTRARGGELPPFTPSDSSTDQRLAALKPGEMSNIEQTDHGFHIVQMIEQLPARTLPYEEVKGEIAQRLETARTKIAVQERVGTLRETAKVELFL
ncbi:MAG: peptidylprolyl isomerase [Acidobacteriota bacterium]